MVVRIQQSASQIVDVANWETDPDYFIFPEGSQPKRLLRSPAEGTEPFLVPDHKYLFKVPVGWQQNQIWSEIIAYEVSRFLDVSVPPAFLAIDSKSGEIGVLIEFFYGHPGEAKKRFIPASDFIHAWLNRNYDRKKGRPHTIRANLTIARSRGIDRYAQWWTKALIFDALIGNVDRHPDNWGLIATPLEGPDYDNDMAPLFDNGTSLAYGITDDRLDSLAANLDAHIARGRHHCSWEAGVAKGTPHVEMCERFLAAYDAASNPSELMIRFTDSAIDSIVEWCSAFDAGLAFSRSRAAFIRASFRRRKALLIGLGP